MSHNKITVAGQSPNSSGNISIDSLNISDLGDVTISSASSDQVIKYDGSGWVNASAPSGSASYILIGQGETSAYSNSGASNLNANSYLEIYDTSPKNTITGASLTTSSDWTSSVTLPAGQYFVQCQTKVSFSASGYLLYSLANTSNNSNVSAGALIGDNATSYASGVASTIQSYISLSSNTTIGIKLGQVSNLDNKTNQGNDISEHTFLLIVKI
tara:strand:+ start:2565 stop:3206 length:642 start_codon:yes stop_codon:yes gene_type:complete